MTKYWPDRDLDHITPPAVLDERGRGMVRSVDRVIGSRALSDLSVRDAETCPAEALPALIAEYSAEEFIQEDLPEHVKRRILKRAWQLQSLKGYDVGVKMGLSLLGTTAHITQWYDMVPTGQANTHRINVYVDEMLWPDDGEYFSERQVDAIWRMINATKRWSQGTELRVGVAARGTGYVGVYPHAVICVTARPKFPAPPTIQASARVAVVATCHINVTAGPKT